MIDRKADEFMTWDMITALITVIGSLIALGTVLAKLISTLTRLDETLRVLQRDLASERENNAKSHERIFVKLDDHETRICSLEHEK